jgi:cytochrome oxidase Cu insertion factor (SCO1/SenC/PrrC family)
MSMPPATEHAVRDPRKLRRTAWILVAIMIVGGFLVLNTYEKWATAQASDTRPAIIHRIQKERDLRLLRQDGNTADLFDLRGRVVALNALSLHTPDTASRSMAVMKRLAQQYAGEQDFRLVTLLIDPIPAEDLRTTLATTAASHGMELPQWWLGSNEPGTLHKFIKNELKATVFPHEAAGTWNYDPAIVLIDRDGHIRRAVVPQTRDGKPVKPAVVGFDFDQAAKWDAEGLKSGTDRSNEEELEILLEKTIGILLAESPAPR